MEISTTSDIRMQIVMKIIFCGQKTEGETRCKTRTRASSTRMPHVERGLRVKKKERKRENIE